MEIAQVSFSQLASGSLVYCEFPLVADNLRLPKRTSAHLTSTIPCVSTVSLQGHTASQ